MNFCLMSAFDASCHSWYIVFIFICFKIFCNFPCDFFFESLVNNMLSHICRLSSFPLAFDFWFHSTMIGKGSSMISLFLNLLISVCDLTCGLSWRMFSVHLRKMYPVVGCNVLYIYVRYNWSILFF